MRNNNNFLFVVSVCVSLNECCKSCANQNILFRCRGLSLAESYEATYLCSPSLAKCKIMGLIFLIDEVSDVGPDICSFIWISSLIFFI